MSKPTASSVPPSDRERLADGGLGFLTPQQDLEFLYRLEKKAILPLKWTIFALCVVLAFAFTPGYSPAFPVFVLLVSYGCSTLFLTYMIAFQRCPLDCIRRLSYVSFGIDVLAMTGLVYLTGGLKSDFYILFFLVVLRGAGYFPTARQNFTVDIIISVVFVLALYLGQPDTESLLNRTFLVRMSLLCGAVLLSWYLMRVQVSERQNTELANARLLLQTEYNRNMLESMTNGVIAVNKAGGVTTTNAAASEILGCEEERIISGGLENLPEPLRECFRDALTQGREHTDQPLDIPRPGAPESRIALRMSTRLIRDLRGNLQGVVAIFEDLSALRHTEEQLWRSERLASVGQLAAGLAHELGNPIGIIKSCAEYMRRKLPQDSQMKEDLEVIDTESDRCQSLVKQLLSLASQDEIQLEQVDLNSVVDRALPLVRYGRQAESLQFAEQLHEEPIPVLLDENLFTQALVNILLNAIQASSQGDVVRIQTLVRDGDNPCAVVSVTDEGCGMDEKTRERIFDPFFTTKELGSGLGLAITYRIVERLGGRIQVQSQAGEGTTLEILLPLQTQQ